MNGAVTLSLGLPDGWVTEYSDHAALLYVGNSDAALKKAYRGWNGTTANHDYNWHDAVHHGTGPCGGNSPQPCDDFGHGTHTLGTIIGVLGGRHCGLPAAVRDKRAVLRLGTGRRQAEPERRVFGTGVPLEECPRPNWRD